MVMRMECLWEKSDRIYGDMDGSKFEIRHALAWIAV
jgi:hypothetical protein